MIIQLHSGRVVDFEPIVQSVLEKRYAVLDGFLYTREVNVMRKEAFGIMERSGFRPAGIGRAAIIKKWAPGVVRPGDADRYYR